jgi:hypothetical protein
LENLFLDTNVIINREFSDNQKKIIEIENFLKEKNKKISTYVYMELNRTVLADAKTLKTYLCDCINLGEIWKRIEALDNSTNMKHRLELIFQKITEDASNLYEAKRILKMWLRHYPSITLKEIIVIPSKTHCEQGQYMPNYDCRGIKSLCRVTENVEKNKAILEALRIELVQDVKSSSDEDRGKLDICWSLNEIINNPEKTKENPRNCFNIGDILIALDVPDNFTLISSDKDFFLICEVLRIPFHYIDP